MFAGMIAPFNYPLHFSIIIDKLRAFFEKYFGVGSSFSSEEDDPEDTVYIQDVYENTLPSAAEQPAGYDTESGL